MTHSFARHWPEYLMEAAGLGLFMIIACTAAIVLEHPASAVRQSLAPEVRLMVTGGLMGLTIICLVYSPWGQRSGAHLNPSVTLTFLRLGKIRSWDALFYSLAQFLGGLSGVLIVSAAAGPLLAHPAVNYAATRPGASGPGKAFAAELAISFGLMLLVLTMSNHPRWRRFTGLWAGLLVATYISLEAPLSGMSMNPARTLASALPARMWDYLWIYGTAPPLGMLLAAEVYLRWQGRDRVRCAKLHHPERPPCHFGCDSQVDPGLAPATGRKDATAALPEQSRP